MRLRWTLPLALALGLSLALAVGSSASSLCPSSFHPHRWYHHVICVRTRTRTSTRTVVVPAAPTRTVTLTPATITAPTQTVTDPVTITNTDTQTQTVTTTTTVTTPPVTTTVTITTSPPNPLSVPSGGRVELAATTTGNFASDPNPLGCLTFSVITHPPGAIWSEYDQQYGLSPNASRDCSCVQNFSGQASGACLYTFGASGSYVITLAANLTDPAYAPAVAASIAEAVQVG